MIRSRNVHRRRLEVQFDRWCASIDRIGARLRKEGVDARLEFGRRLDGLRARREQALRELGRSLENLEASLKNEGICVR